MTYKSIGPKTYSVATQLSVGCLLASSLLGCHVQQSDAGRSTKQHLAKARNAAEWSHNNLEPDDDEKALALVSPHAKDIHVVTIYVGGGARTSCMRWNLGVSAPKLHFIATKKLEKQDPDVATVNPNGSVSAVFTTYGGLDGFQVYAKSRSVLRVVGVLAACDGGQDILINEQIQVRRGASTKIYSALTESLKDSEQSYLWVKVSRSKATPAPLPSPSPL